MHCVDLGTLRGSEHSRPSSASHFGDWPPPRGNYGQPSSAWNCSRGLLHIFQHPVCLPTASGEIRCRPHQRDLSSVFMTVDVPDPQLFISFSFEPQRFTEDGVTVRASCVLPPSHFDEEEHPWSTWQSPVLPLRDFCHDCPLLRQMNTCAMCWDGKLVRVRTFKTKLGVSWRSLHAPRGGDSKTPVREGEGTREPWRRGATGCRRLSRQLMVCGQGLQRGETMDNDFALAEATACRAARTIFHIPRW